MHNRAGLLVRKVMRRCFDDLEVKALALCVLCAALLALFCVCEIGRAEGNLSPTEQAELLRQVANGWRANFESIRTWKGVGKVTMLQKEDKEEGLVVERREADAHFAYDAESAARRWRWHYTLLGSNKTGAMKTNLRGQDFEQTSSAMFKDGAYYRFEFWDKPSETRKHTVWIGNADNPRIKVRDSGTDLDPLFFFRHNRLRTVHDRLKLTIDALENPDDKYRKGISVERQGNIVTLKSDSSSTIYEYDLSKGFNLVKMKKEFTSEEKQWERTYLYEWQEKDGVYYPKGYSYTEHASGKAGLPVVLKREIVFEDVEFNEPLGESEFSLESLGVKPGDKVMDRIIGANYVYGTPDSKEAIVDIDELEEPAAEDASAAPEPADRPPVAVAEDEAVVAAQPAAEEPLQEPGGGAFVPVVGALVLLVIAVVVAVLRRRR